MPNGVRTTDDPSATTGRPTTKWSPPAQGARPVGTGSSPKILGLLHRLPLAFLVFVDRIPARFAVPPSLAIVALALFFFIRHRDLVAAGGLGAIAILLF